MWFVKDCYFAELICPQINENYTVSFLQIKFNFT